MPSLACTSFLVLVIVQVIQADFGVILDHGKPTYESCCYGDETFEHGDVVLTLEHVCLQLVCENGKVVRRYLEQPGDKYCCEFDGTLYQEGHTLITNCILMTCNASCWQPIEKYEACCRYCTVYDDPHITTFDSHHYHYHDACNYSMAQTGSSHLPEVGVFSEFEKCFGYGSCLSGTTFRNDPNTIITLNNGAVFDILVNGNPFYIDEPNKVYKLKSSEGCHSVLAWRSPWGEFPPDQQPYCLRLFGSSKIVIEHCPNSLHILAHAAHLDNLDGLCGHYNNHVDDDFTSRAGDLFELAEYPLGFANSWKTNAQSNSVCRLPCKDCHLYNTTNPCPATPIQLNQYFVICNETLFPILDNQLPHLDNYIEDCVFDLCVDEAYTGNTDFTYWLNVLARVAKTEVLIHTHLAEAAGH